MYKIRLEAFEGPLDLLLFFIKRDELNIYDIPISVITKEFLDYLHIISILDLEVAGDFILMASSLMHIKVRMLLPREVDEKGEEIDPRADLVARLLEYKKYKEMAEEISYFESAQRKLSTRGYLEMDEKEAPPELSTLLRNVTVFDLAKAFRKAMEAQKPEFVHEIKLPPVTIDQQISYVADKLKSNRKASFVEIITGIKEKIRIVVTFIALLEMVRRHEIGIRETENFNDFEVYLLENGPDLQISN